MIPKEKRIKRQQRRIWNFKTGSWSVKPPMTRQEEMGYRTLHHNVAALYYVAHQNTKAYKILYPLCALAQLGLMMGLCMVATPIPVKVASMIAFPLSAATVMRRKKSAIEEARQAKEECHHLLSRFEKVEPMPPLTGPVHEKYPAMWAQAKTFRADLLKSDPVGWRYTADLGNELWKEERQRG